MTYIALMSGGKDSVAMCDLLCKHNYPLDYILWIDTKLEFPIMYEYMEKVKKHFKEKYNREIITINADIDPYEFMERRIERTGAKLKGYKIGIFASPTGFCRWRDYGKYKPFKKWLKSNNIDEYKTYIGIALDEKHRANDPDALYPLITDFKMSEKDCLEYTKKIGLYNPLYDYFERTGCSICPLMSEKNKFIVYKYFPETWNKMKEVEQKFLKEQEQGEKIACTTFHYGKTLDELEKIFKLKNYEKNVIIPKQKENKFNIEEF